MVPGVGERLHLTLEVPAIQAAARPPLHLRIVALFRERITAPLRQSIEGIVARLFPARAGTSQPAPITGLDIVAAIKADLRRLHPDVEIDVQVTAGAADFYVAELEVGHVSGHA